MKKLLYISCVLLSACSNIDNSLYKDNADLAYLYGEPAMNIKFEIFRKGQSKEEVLNVLNQDGWKFLGEKEFNAIENDELDNLIIAQKNDDGCKGIYIQINKGTGLDSVLPLDCRTTEKMVQDFVK